MIRITLYSSVNSYKNWKYFFFLELKIRYILSKKYILQLQIHYFLGEMKYKLL